MTQVIHGLTREQLVSHVFNRKTPVATAITTLLVKGEIAAQRDYRSNNSGNSKKGGGMEKVQVSKEDEQLIKGLHDLKAEAMKDLHQASKALTEAKSGLQNGWDYIYEKYGLSRLDELVIHYGDDPFLEVKKYGATHD